MFTGKVIASLFLIATAGALDAGRGLVGGDSVAMALPCSNTPALASIPTVANSSSMGQVRAAVAVALQARVRADLNDRSLTVDVSGLSLRRDSANLVSVDGQARVSLGAGGVLPLRVEADWNAGEQRIERIDYRVTGAATAQLAARAAGVMPDGARIGAARIGAALHAAIQDKVGADIGREFAAQHPEFQLVAVDSVASGRYSMVVAGTGITRFPGEGAAFTRFSANIGKFDGRVMRVDYELLQELDPRAVSAL